MNPAIPTPEQVRSLKVTSIAVFRKGLTGLGLRVTTGGAHLRVETADGTFVGTAPISPSCPHALKNCRSYLAKRIGQLRRQGDNSTHHNPSTAP